MNLDELVRFIIIIFLVQFNSFFAEEPEYVPLMTASVNHTEAYNCVLDSLLYVILTFVHRGF